jgi:hypothetical protein
MQEHLHMNIAYIVKKAPPVRHTHELAKENEKHSHRLDNLGVVVSFKRPA